MKTLTERLNFSDRPEHSTAVKVNKETNVSFHEILSRYCTDNFIDFDENASITDEDWINAVERMAEHGVQDEYTDHYYFWID